MKKLVWMFVALIALNAGYTVTVVDGNNKFQYHCKSFMTRNYNTVVIYDLYDQSDALSYELAIPKSALVEVSKD